MTEAEAAAGAVSGKQAGRATRASWHNTLGGNQAEKNEAS